MNRNSGGGASIAPPPKFESSTNGTQNTNKGTQKVDKSDTKEYDYSKVVTGMTDENLKDSDIKGYVKYFDKNKAPSYNNQDAEEVSGGMKGFKTFTNLVQCNAISKTPESNTTSDRVAPGYYDNIMYEHRKNLLLAMNEHVENIFRIGDCMFAIPPEFISVTSTSGYKSIQAMRQSGSIKSGHGYSQSEIIVNIPINKLEQINGIEVESPFTNNYFLDGLRPLIAQFKATPFVPVVNSTLNITNKIHAVALRALNVETVPGFPELLTVQLVMDSFNTVPYIGAESVFFDKFINWDLFRYYYQRYLWKDSKNYIPKMKNDNGEIRLSVLKESVLCSDKEQNRKEVYINLGDDKNYRTLIDEKSNIKVTAINYNISNIMPSIQMSDAENPTFQYLGCSDTRITIAFETTDEATAMIFSELKSNTLSVVRANPHKSSLGFFKIKNSFINMTAEHFVIETLQVNTIPNFPGSFYITLQCISYDSRQKDRERVYGIMPIVGEPSKDDLISLEEEGIRNKFLQDYIADKELDKINLYPDLMLPTYLEAEKALESINNFRANKGFKIINTSIHKPSGTVISDDNIVEPDFYMTYPRRLSDITVIEQDESVKNQFKDFTNYKFGNESEFEKETSEKDNKKNNKQRSYSYSADDLIYDSNSSTSYRLLSSNFNSDNKFKTYIAPIVPDCAIQPEYYYGYEPSKAKLHKKGEEQDENKDYFKKLIEIIFGGLTKDLGSISGGGSGNPVVGTGEPGDPTKDPKSVPNRMDNPFLDLILDRCESGCGYVFGSDGQICTQEFCDEKIAAYGPSGMESTESYKWIGKQVFDCSGIISWAMRRLGMQGDGWRSTDTGLMSLCTPISKGDLQPGDLCQKSGHIGVYVKDGITVEAMSTADGVKYGKVDPFYNFGRLVGISEANDKAKKNPEFYTNATHESATELANGNKKDDKKETASSNRSNLRLLTTRTPIAVKGEEIATPSTEGERVEPTIDNLMNRTVKFPGKPVLGKLPYEDAGMCDKWDNLILKHSATWNLDPNFIKCLIYNESRGNPDCGPNDYNCYGLCQVQATYYKVRGGNYHDPDANIEEGVRIFFSAGLNPDANFDVDRWICGFNCGEG